MIHPNGLTLHGCEEPIPPGVDISVPIQPIHLDEDIYPDAHKYVPLRFCEDANVRRMQRNFAGRGEEGSETEKLPRGAQKSTVTIDDAFLGFGVVGRHACPGRFFALVEMKIFVAHLLLNYEVEPLKTRPQPVKLMWLNYPSSATVRVRKRDT